MAFRRASWWRRSTGLCGESSERRVMNVDRELIPYLFILLGIVVFLVAVVQPGGVKIQEWVGRLKWWHRLVVGVVGLTLVGSGWCARQNNAPEANFSVSPTGPGMQRLTNFSFNASSSSDLDNDQLTYAWDFGDGSTNSGEEATHIYHHEAGTFTVTLRVSDGKSQATSSQDVTVHRGIAGSYFSYNRPDDRHEYEATLDLTQAAVSTNGRITGAIMRPIRWTYRNGSGSGANHGDVGLDGIITSDNNFVCPCDVQFESAVQYEPRFYSFDGVLELGASAMVGQIQVRNIQGFETNQRVTYTRPRR